MQIKNTAQRYGAVAITLHWVMALLIIGMLTLGLYMVGVPISLEKLQLYGLHKEFGVTVLMLVTLRVLWRWTNITPLLPNTMPAWQKLAAHGAHFALYALMFAMPLTGWALSSAAGLPVSFFGLFTLPNLVAPNDGLRLLLTTTHKYLAFSLIAVLCAHVAAALQHHFFNKDDILKRILP